MIRLRGLQAPTQDEGAHSKELAAFDLSFLLPPISSTSKQRHSLWGSVIHSSTVFQTSDQLKRSIIQAAVGVY